MNKESIKSVDINSQVRVLRLDEYKPAAKVLAEAFWKDDVARYFLDTPSRARWTDKQKWDLHLSIMEYVTYGHLMVGLCTTIGEDYSCVALWMPPYGNTDTFHVIFLSGLWRLYYKLCNEGRTRMFTEFYPLLHDTKAAVLGARDLNSYYLVYVGTKPSAQGQGLARKLISHTTRQADGERRACYLESSNVRNVAIYERIGFKEVGHRIALARGDKKVELDIMVHEPPISDSDKIVGKVIESVMRKAETTKIKVHINGRSSEKIKKHTTVSADLESFVLITGNEKTLANAAIRV